MEFSVRIDLTDPKYEDYMKKTTTELVETPEFKEAFREAVLEIYSDAIRKNAVALVNKALIGNWYNNNQEVTIGKELIKDSLTEYSESIKDAMKDYAKECLSKTDIDNIVRAILFDAIREGLLAGMKEFCERTTSTNMVASNDINRIKARLGL